MNRYILLILFAGTFSLSSKAQFGVAFHQSNLPFFDFNYEDEQVRGIEESALGFTPNLSVRIKI